MFLFLFTILKINQTSIFEDLSPLSIDIVFAKFPKRSVFLFLFISPLQGLHLKNPFMMHLLHFHFVTFICFQTHQVTPPPADFNFIFKSVQFMPGEYSLILWPSLQRSEYLPFNFSFGRTFWVLFYLDFGPILEHGQH